MSGTGFELRRAVAPDASAMWAIRAQAIRRTCRSHYPVELLERWAASPMPVTFADNIAKEYFVVGVAESRIAGFAALKPSSAKIDAVFVAPGHGRRGLGRRLLAHLEAVAAQSGLESLGVCASLNAVPFYFASGFAAIGAEEIYTTSAGVEIACLRMQKVL